MSGFKFSNPGAGKSGFTKDDHQDHLIAFVGVTFEPDVSTSYGESDAARVDTVACLDCPVVVNDQLVFGSVLVDRLCSAEDPELVLARLVRGTAKPGRSAPWLLEEPTSEDIKEAEAFFEAYATRLKSGRIMIEIPDDDPPAAPSTPPSGPTRGDEEPW